MDIEIKKTDDSTECQNGKPHQFKTVVGDKKLPKHMCWCEYCGAIGLLKDGLLVVPYIYLKGKL